MESPFFSDVFFIPRGNGNRDCRYNGGNAYCVRDGIAAGWTFDKSSAPGRHVSTTL